MKAKFNVIKPNVWVYAGSSAPTITHYVGLIDWFFPKAKKNEHPGIYTGRVARFMREWNGLTLKEASAKFGISYMSLWRIEKGKWQSIKKTSNYLFNAYGLQMKFNFGEIKPNKPKPNISKEKK